MTHHRQLRLMTATALLSIAVSLAGCIGVDETLTLSKDGSGSYRIRYSMTPEAIRRMEWAFDTARSLQSESGSVPAADKTPSAPPLLFDDALITRDIEALRSRGIVLTKLKTDTTKGMSRVDLTIRFDSLSGLAATRFFTHRRLALTAQADETYSLSISTPAANRKSTSEDSIPLSDENTSPILAGLRVTTTLKVPGQLVNSSARITATRSATWEFEYDRDRLALIRLQSTVMSARFKGHGLTIPTFDSAKPKPLRR